MIDILQKITAQRVARNWTEYQLALHSGLPQSTISSWYRKNMLPSIASLQKNFVTHLICPWLNFFRGKSKRTG